MAKPEGGEHSFINDSPWVAVQRQVNQAHELRVPILQEIQKLLGGKVYTYFASFFHWEGQVSDDHAEMLENMFSVEHDGGKLFLIVNSPGGQALAAERIVNVCRAYSKGDFEVIVPHMAKSAATMICFGAKAIHMSRTSELGPVDPQVRYKKEDEERPGWISAAEYIRSYEKLVNAATSGKATRIEPYLQQLARYDSRHIEQLISHQELSDDISIRLLKSCMMRRWSNTTIRKRISPFLVQKQKSSHGRMIGYEESKRCGLVVKELPLDSDLWKAVWRLYVSSDFVVGTRAATLIESCKSSISRAFSDR